MKYNYYCILFNYMYIIIIIFDITNQILFHNSINLWVPVVCNKRVQKSRDRIELH